MRARPIAETVERFRRAARSKDLASQYGILEGLSACLIVNHEVNEWAVVTLVECAKIGHRYRNTRTARTPDQLSRVAS
jgi:hypothetical protein